MNYGLDQAGARFAADAAHHAEIQVGKPAVGQGQQVARMGIGVEEAMFQQLLQAAANAHSHQLIRIYAQGSHRL